METNTIDVSAEVQAALPQVLQRMRDNIAEQVGERARYVAMEEVSKAVRDWALENLVPEIKAQLEAGREGMVKQAQTISKQLGDALAEALTEQAAKTLKSSSAVTDIAQKLFRGY